MEYGLNESLFRSTSKTDLDLDYYGDYAAKWGVTDWYPEVEEKISELLKSGEPFLATGSVHKEIQYFAIARNHEGKIVLSVRQAMDEDYDLIDDCLQDEDIELTTDQMDQILEIMYDIDTAVFATDTIDDDSIESIKNKLGELLDATDRLIKENFENAQSIVTDYVNALKDQGESNG